MPNYCQNYVTFSHPDPLMIERIIQASDHDNGKGLFMEFFPTPQKLMESTSPSPFAEENMKEFGYEDWYHWNVDNWGTKWNTYPDDVDKISENEVHLCFDTAWAPPLAFYEKMESLGFTIDALYHEPGVGFAGLWNDEFGAETFEYDFNDPDWSKNMPAEVKDLLEVEYEDYMAWKELNEADTGDQAH